MIRFRQYNTQTLGAHIHWNFSKYLSRYRNTVQCIQLVSYCRCFVIVKPIEFESA